MATLKQIAANRLNSQRSTGPRSVNGKAESRMNAFKSGLYAKSQIVRGESQADLEALKAEYHNHHRPASPEARALVDDLVNAEWLKRRFRVIEAQIMQAAADSPYFDPKHPLGDAYDRCDATLIRLQRRIDATDRLYHRALTALRKLQAERTLSTPEPDPIELHPTPLPPTSSPSIGFVPSPDPVAPTERSAAGLHTGPMLPTTSFPQSPGYDDPPQL